MILVSIILLFVHVIWSYGVILTVEIKYEFQQILFHFGLMEMIVCAINYNFLQERITPTIYLHVILSCILLGVGQFMFTIGLIYAKNVGVTIMIGFSVVLFAYFFSIFRYHQKVNIFCLLGAFLLVAGIWFVVSIEEKLKSRQPVALPGRISEKVFKNDTQRMPEQISEKN